MFFFLGCNMRTQGEKIELQRKVHWRIYVRDITFFWLHAVLLLSFFVVEKKMFQKMVGELAPPSLQCLWPCCMIKSFFTKKLYIFVGRKLIRRLFICWSFFCCSVMTSYLNVGYFRCNQVTCRSFICCCFFCNKTKFYIW